VLPSVLNDTWLTPEVLSIALSLRLTLVELVSGAPLLITIDSEYGGVVSNIIDSATGSAILPTLSFALK